MKRMILVILLILFLLPASATMYPQAYTMIQYVIAGGGGHSTGGPYALEFTVAQPVVGTVQGGSYQIGAGFLHPSVYYVWLPLIMNHYQPERE